MENHEPLKTESSLVIDARVNFDDYKTYWFDYFKRSLPNSLIFWGIFSLGSLFFAYLLRLSTIAFWSFTLLSIFLIIIPSLMYFFNYREFMRNVSKHISELGEQEKNYSMIFKPDSDGFDIVHGKNFSHIAWSSVKNVAEMDAFFIFRFGVNPFLLSKNNFKNEVETNEFRQILINNLGSKVKFLNQ